MDTLFKVLTISGLSVYLDENKGKRTTTAAAAAAISASGVVAASPFVSAPAAGGGVGGASAAAAAPIVSARSASTVSHAYIVAPFNMSAKLTMQSKVLAVVC